METGEKNARATLMADKETSTGADRKNKVFRIAAENSNEIIRAVFTKSRIEMRS